MLFYTPSVLGIHCVLYTRRNGCDAQLTFMPAAHTISFRYKEAKYWRNANKPPEMFVRRSAKQRYK